LFLAARRGAGHDLAREAAYGAQEPCSSPRDPCKISGAGTKNFSGQVTNTPTSNWYSGAFSSTSLGCFNRTELTQLRLRFALDDNNLTANYLRFASGNAITTSRPQLIISYYVPEATSAPQDSRYRFK
jgi:hypothetical protein